MLHSKHFLNCAFSIAQSNKYVKTLNVDNFVKVIKQVKTRKYCHLTQFDRDRIQALLNSGHKQTEIAKILKKDKSTITSTAELDKALEARV